MWLTDRPDMTLDVYRGCKTTIQSINQSIKCFKVKGEANLPFLFFTSFLYGKSCERKEFSLESIFSFKVDLILKGEANMKLRVTKGRKKCSEPELHNSSVKSFQSLIKSLQKIRSFSNFRLNIAC